MLVKTAEIIQSVLFSKDVAARLGGDEFIVMLKDVKDEEDVVAIRRKNIKKFSNFY